MIALTRRTALWQTAALGAVLAMPPHRLRAASREAPPVLPEPYVARGVGGGGAFVGFSMSPYQRLWFVGTDMGTLFRSTNEGASWQAVPHTNAVFLETLNNQDYTDLPGIGYSASPNVVFHAPATGSPLRSLDGGITWSPMTLGDANCACDSGSGFEPSGPGLCRARRRHRRDRGRRGELDPAGDQHGAGPRPVSRSRRRCPLCRVRLTASMPHAMAAPASRSSFPPTSCIASPGDAAAVSGLRLCPQSAGSRRRGIHRRPVRHGAGEVATPQGTVALAAAEHVQMAENDDVVYVAGACGARTRQAPTFGGRAEAVPSSWSSARPTKVSAIPPGRPCDQAPSAWTSATGTAATTPSR